MVVPRFIVVISSMLVVFVDCWARAEYQPRADPNAADALLRAGKFAESEQLFLKADEQDQNNYGILTRLGFLTLLSNRTGEAQRYLERVLKIKSDHGPATAMLAEALCRQDNFPRAAPYFLAAGQKAKSQALASFGDAVPYQIEGQHQTTRLKFVVTDPLPLVRVRINGSEEVNFMIDTGAAEVVLDSQFAREVEAKSFGSIRGSFAGGQQADFQYGTIDSLTLGDWSLKNVPVHILDTRRFSGPIFGGRRVDGIIGTILLYHFLATLDYPQGELVLKRKSRSTSLELDRTIRRDQRVVVPFWLGGDHYVVARGKVNEGPLVLLFVDTGLAGGGVSLTPTALKNADIKLADSDAAEGLGAGGKVKVTPFVVKNLSLGEAKETNVRGLFTGPFPLESALGFRLAGLVSHGFFRPYAVTFDFVGMRLILKRQP